MRAVGSATRNPIAALRIHTRTNPGSKPRFTIVIASDITVHITTHISTTNTKFTRDLDDIRRA